MKFTGHNLSHICVDWYQADVYGTYITKIVEIEIKLSKAPIIDAHGFSHNPKYPSSKEFENDRAYMELQIHKTLNNLIRITWLSLHSFLSLQLPLASPSNPTKQSQMKDPSVLTQPPFKHRPTSSHSSTSTHVWPSNLKLKSSLIDHV
jgi:hypothetical protein